MATSRNGKVTLAVLDTKMTTLIKEVAELSADIKRMLPDMARQGAQIADLKDNHEALASRVNTWSSLNSVGVFLAGLLGAIFGPRQ